MNTLYGIIAQVTNTSLPVPATITSLYDDSPEKKQFLCSGSIGPSHS